VPREGSIAPVLSRVVPVKVGQDALREGGNPRNKSKCGVGGWLAYSIWHHNRGGEGICQLNSEKKGRVEEISRYSWKSG